MSENILEFEGEGWQYTLDLTNLPDYELVHVKGKVTADQIRHYIDTIIQYVNEHYGPDASFPPNITDISGAEITPSVLRGVRATSQPRLRARLAITILPPGTLDSAVYHAFTQFAETISAANVRFVSSMEEALELVREYWSQQRGD
jgi:hypothetical protein